ncbi:Endonuclease/Exonuclease/phosphatase family protein [Desulfocicer vacuolatum DSM 3385]|uniref:Endonuclease/Exonuclease/phosphatase family protein n=2 Tax=Desulfocicer vacuolatum TaxID=2298 RepID=A0A1W2ENN7_9BACT|nr:Endonuclease/Exonuclease/phosphatase family protein [Desulfocicer vacuolatum DSM 3385]
MSGGIFATENLDLKACFMKKTGFFYLSLFVCSMIFMGCCWKTSRQNAQIGSASVLYGLQSHFSIPGPGFVFDVLADGRLIGVSGNGLFMETGLETRDFNDLGPLPGLKTGPYGPSFLKVSPDGTRFALGDGNGRIGIYNINSMASEWFAMPHFDAEWADNTLMVVSHGEFGEPGRLSFVPLAGEKRVPVTLIRNIGGAPAGIAFDSRGNLFTANGFKSSGPSGTGTVKYFPRNLWQSAMRSHSPLDFEAQGQVIVDILSGSSLGFDHRGNLHVGGSDAFGDGKDVNFAALITRGALDEAIRNNVAVDPTDAHAVHRFDPDKENATSRYILNFNPVTRELYFFSDNAVYVYRPGVIPVSGEFSSPAEPREPIAPRPVSPSRSPGTLRVMTYNVCGNFLADTRLDDTFARIFSHVAPDIFVFQEFTTTMASQLPGRLKALLGGTWYVFGGMGSGIYQTMIASRYPLVLTSRDTLPPSDIRGITAALVDLPGETFSRDLYLMGFHLQCCDSPEFKARRQRSADAAMAWIRDAKTAGGAISLPLQTPMILTGDFNFIGKAGPEITFTTGNIKDEAVFGPDVMPDWDDSHLKDLLPRDANTGKINTWPGSATDPDIRYDRFYYTDSVLPSVRGFVLNTLNFNEKQLAQAGLKKADTVFASDHLPVIMDVQFP